MTDQIPPEGDDYDKQRQEEMYASITNKAMLVRRHAEMLRDGAPLEQIDQAVAAMAQTERDIARLSLELHNSTQGKNLNIFLMRFDAALKENAEAAAIALKENADANTAVLAAVNSNLTLISLSVESVLKKFTRFEKDVGALKKGQTTVNAQMVAIKKQLVRADHEREEIQQQQADLAHKLDAYIGAEHDALVREVAGLKDRLDRLEHAGKAR